MKIISSCAIIVAILLAFSHCSFSQGWFKGEPNWEYQYWGGCSSFTNGYEKVLYDGDTIIDGQPMKTFAWSHYSNTMGDIIEWEKSLIMYEKNDTVYHYQEESSPILYDFTYEQGDTMIIDYFESSRYCDSLLYLRLDTLEIMAIGDQNLRVQKWRVLNNLEYVEDGTVVVEGIGSLGSRFFDMKSSLQCGLDFCYAYGFTCFYDAVREYGFPGKTCSQITLSASNQSLN